MAALEPRDSTGSTSWTSPGAGVTGGYTGHSETFRIFIVFFAGLASYNAVELVAMILLMFRRRRGWYFWSLLISSIGIVPYSLGFLLKFMNLAQGQSRWSAIVLLTIGWYAMVTGQALVLWSRLHLIVSGPRGDKIIKYTRWMIIVNAICLHIPTTVLTFGSNGNLETGVFESGYNIMEKIQMCGFFCQEVILSSIYIVETVKILRTSLQANTRTTMKQLVLINAVIICMDLILLGLEAASLYILETLIKGVVYSIKLKLEFAILSKLIKFVGAQQWDDRARQSVTAAVSTGSTDRNNLDTRNTLDFVDLTRIGTDVTHAAQTSRSSYSARKWSNVMGSENEYAIARFEHVQDVTSFDDKSDERLYDIKEPV